jgi:hypothetical protein
LFFNNLVICHIESSVSQLSLFSLVPTISLYHFAAVDSILNLFKIPGRHQNQHCNYEVKSTR